jgi:ABC-2 type transport system permease protein
MNAPLHFFVVPAFTAFRYQAKANVSTISVMVTWILSPIVMGAVAALLYESLDADQLVKQAVLGTIVTGSWTTSVFLTFNTLGADRWSGVLELILATPARMSGIMAGKLLASAIQGLFAALVAVAVVSLIGRTVIDVERPLLLCATLPFAVLGIASFAMLFSTLMFISRAGVAGIFAILDSGLLFVSAVLYPVTVLPDWLQVVAKASPLRWSAEALVRSASADASPGDIYEAWAVLAALTVVYGVAAILAYETLERRLRATGELSTF